MNTDQRRAGLGIHNFNPAAGVIPFPHRLLKWCNGLMRKSVIVYILILDEETFLGILKRVPADLLDNPCSACLAENTKAFFA